MSLRKSKKRRPALANPSGACSQASKVGTTCCRHTDALTGPSTCLLPHEVRVLMPILALRVGMTRPESLSQRAQALQSGRVCRAAPFLLKMGFLSSLLHTWPL